MQLPPEPEPKLSDEATVQLEAWLAQATPSVPFYTVIDKLVSVSLHRADWTISYLHRLLQHPALAAHPEAHGRALQQLAMTLMNVRRWDEAEQALQLCAELAHRAGLHRVRLLTLGNQMRLRILRCDLIGASALAPVAFDAALAAADAGALVVVLDSMSIITSCTGRHERADALSQQALLTLRTSPEAWRPGTEAVALHNRCVSLMLAVLDAFNRGNQGLMCTRLASTQLALVEAKTAAERSRSTMVEKALGPLQALSAVLRGQRPTHWPDINSHSSDPGVEMYNASYGLLAQALAARRSGDDWGALRHAKQALEHAHHDQREFEVTLAALRELSQLHAARGDWEAAWDMAQQAQAVTRQRDEEQAGYAISDALAHMRGEHDLAATMIGRNLREPVAAISALAAAGDDGDATQRLHSVARLSEQALGHADAFLRSAELLQLDGRLWSDIYVPGLVAEAVDEAHHACGGVALKVVEAVEPELGLHSHARTLHRLLVGLLLEAQQAAVCAGTTATVEVRARRSAESVLLSVHRQGPPFAVNDLRGVFEDGLQLSEGQPGALALRYAARAARALGGVATAVNCGDGSATLALSLPMAVPSLA